MNPRLVPVMRRSAALVLALALTVGAGRAQVPILPRPSPPRLVNDYAALLAPAERDALERKLVAYSDSTSTQITVVLLPTLGGAEPSQFATELGEAWGVGGAANDNGAVVLVAVEDRDVFIATGRGLEGALPDVLAGRIVRDVIVPAFRAGQFYAGLDAGTTAIMQAAAGEFTATERAPSEGGPGAFVVLVVLLLVVLVALSLAHRRSDDEPPPGRRRRRSHGGPGIIFLPGGWSGGGGGGFGGGFSGGFGGFGGGSFGGGGAGGSW